MCQIHLGKYTYQYKFQFFNNNILTFYSSGSEHTVNYSNFVFAKKINCKSGEVKLNGYRNFINLPGPLGSKRKEYSEKRLLG